MSQTKEIPLLDLKEGVTLAINKPLTWSSFSVVNKFRYEACKYLGIKKLKVGHAGTLDPLATGVMVLCTGKHTKRIEELQSGRKEYIARVRFGQTTPTFDMESEPDAFYPWEHITRAQIEEVLLRQFTGEIMQVPPAFSAVKVDGKRAYDLARKGRDFELQAKPLHIYEIELLEEILPDITLRIVCSKGTYIRAIARDLGTALGSGGHLTALERTQVGDYRLEDCIASIEEIPQWLSTHVQQISQEENNHIIS